MVYDSILKWLTADGLRSTELRSLNTAGKKSHEVLYCSQVLLMLATAIKFSS